MIMHNGTKKKFVMVIRIIAEFTAEKSFVSFQTYIVIEDGHPKPIKIIGAHFAMLRREEEAVCKG
jgi:hypothetical protein